MKSGTKRRLILLGCVAAVCLVVVAFLTWPRSIESLVGIPPEKVTFWGLEAYSSENEGLSISSQTEGRSAEEDLRYLYGLTFSWPTWSPNLYYETGSASYSLVFSGADGQKRFDLLEDGTLWDGTWRYSLVGGETALAGLQELLNGLTLYQQ